MTRILYSTIIIFSLSLVSCSQRGTLQRSMNKNKIPLGYLSDSRLTDCKDSTHVVSFSVKNNPLDSITHVSTINNLVVPLIIYYLHEVNIFIQLGQKSLEQPYDEFFKEKLIEESKRSACYSVKGQSNKGYLLELTFENNSNTLTTYSMKSESINLLFIWLHRGYSKGFPSKTTLNVSAVLSKNGIEVYKNHYNVAKEQSYLNTAGIKTRGFPLKVESNLVESLSLTTKDCIEKIVNDVDEFLIANP